MVSNARDNRISKGRLKNRIVMDVCEFCYSTINSLYQTCVSSVELSEGGSCDIKDIQNPCNYSLQGFSAIREELIGRGNFGLIYFVKYLFGAIRSSLSSYDSIFA